MSEAKGIQTEVIPVIATVAAQPIAADSSMPRRSHKALIITLSSIAGALVLLALAAFLTGRFYLDGRAPLGATFAGQNVSGKSQAELASLVEKKADDTHFVLTADNGNTVTATYDDLGVSVDVDQTVANIVSSKGTNPFSKVAFFLTAATPLDAEVDAPAVQDYLIQALVKEDSKIVLPSITYTPDSKSFTVVPGKDGLVAVSAPVEKAVAASFSTDTESTEVTVELTQKAAPISSDEARKAATTATDRLSRKLVVTNGSEKTFTIPSEKIAEWTTTAANTDKGTIEVSYNDEAITAYLAEQLPAALNQEKVDQENIVSPQGQRLLVRTAGHDGVVVSDTSQAATQVIDALNAGKDVTATVTAKVTTFETKNTEVPSNFGVPNGDPWLLVDLTSQTVTAYRGTTQVNHFNVSTGLPTPDRVSDTGTFYMWHKTTSQTMRGPGYVTPNVKWVSYYNGGEGFHAAPWNLNGIAKGVAGSHGCINMIPSEAQWVYDFAPIGTKVEVVGTTPDGASR